MFQENPESEIRHNTVLDHSVVFNRNWDSSYSWRNRDFQREFSGIFSAEKSNFLLLCGNEGTVFIRRDKYCLVIGNWDGWQLTADLKREFWKSENHWWKVFIFNIKFQSEAIGVCPHLKVFTWILKWSLFSGNFEEERFVYCLLQRERQID